MQDSARAGGDLQESGNPLVYPVQQVDGCHKVLTGLIESGLRNTLMHLFQRLPRDSRERRANELINKFSPSQGYRATRATS